MQDSVNRFSDRVENYARYRPGYPPALIDVLASNCQLQPGSVIADVGSGPGNLTSLFISNGNHVFAIEPNRQMRAMAEHLWGTHPNFISVDGTAEATTIEDQSVDFITAGQAFHWFDQNLARTEFRRILQPNGWVVLAWNERRIDSTVFLREFEDLLLKFGTDYQSIRHEKVQKDLQPFFAPEPFDEAALENLQEFDFAGLRGRLLSSSYVPQAGQENYEEMLADLERIFLIHQTNGKVVVEYDAKIYYGHLLPR